MDFNKYFKKPVKIKKLKGKGITNFNYLTNNGYIIKQYTNLVKNNELAVTSLIEEFDVETKLINKEVKITKFYNDGQTLEDEPINEKKTKQIAKLIAKLHNKQIKCNVYFNPKKVVLKYLSKIKKPLLDFQKYMFLIKQVKEIYPGRDDLILCHNDLTAGNFLFTKQKLFLIDWEYAGMNDSLFDVVSFLSENNLYNTKYKEIFLNEYFAGTEIPWEKIEIWNNFQNLLWAIWANMMYDSRPDQIYLDIFNYKIKNLKEKLLEKR